METKTSIYTASSCGGSGLALSAPAPATIPDATLVPDELQNELMMWRDWFTAGYFRIGDIALQIVDQSLARGLPVTRAQIYSAVGRFCGKSGRTVRYYADVALFFPVGCEVRPDPKRFEPAPPYDALSFRVFALATSYPDRWREILDYALLNPQLSEDGLRFWLGQSVCAGIEESDSENEPQEIFTPLPSDTANAQIAGRPVQTSAFRELSDLASLIERVESAFKNIWVSNETRVRLRMCLDEMREILKDIHLETSG